MNLHTKDEDMDKMGWLAVVWAIVALIVVIVGSIGWVDFILPEKW